MVLHEAVKEWQRWKYEVPMRYTTVDSMPMLVAIGFDFLTKKLGRKEISTENHESTHDDFVARLKADKIDKSTEIKT